MVQLVELIEAKAEHRPTVANLLQLCLHDFSEFASIGTSYGEVAADGTFSYPWLDLYWTESGRVPLLIKADGNIAGFVLIGSWSALDRSVDRSVSELFILRKYRRHRIGSRVASILFAWFRCTWEVPVAHYNAPALMFWRKAVVDAIGQAAEEFQGDGQRWAGPVLCFQS